MHRLLLLLALMAIAAVPSNAAEYNPVQRHVPSIGPEAGRLIVGFRPTSGNAVVQTFQPRAVLKAVKIVRANTTAADVNRLAARVGLSLAKSRQITPGMHVLFLKQTLYGGDVATTLARLRADPAVKFADIDGRRYPTTVPNDPLFVATTGATGQWYMQTPGSVTGDLSATDAVSAWTLTMGSSGTVIADVDSGVRFDHPDLGRAGLGGRLLPGYDFVGQDYDPTTGAALGTFLAANDGDGWDPDPSDPGDWIDSTDQQQSAFPSADCPIADSSWHGTRVVGILGALTNNDVGIAGMTWNPWILPVRALGKCGGYDSDIIAGIEWAAGISVSTAENTVPDNPYPAGIINLSLGGTGTCSSVYQDALGTVTGMGVLVVISAGNESGSVGQPANCSALVSGVIAVAGLRNVGTKVGYSSFGPEVGVSAPAGNCINSSGACLRSIDTTTNVGLTVPGTNSFTNQIEPNLGTSFSAPIVAGIAGLMRAVNANLTPALLVARLEASATAFPPNTGNLPVCPTLDSATSECSCPATGECGTGMVNALAAVTAAQNPVAAVSFPAAYAAGAPVIFDASASAAACGRTVHSYAWSVAGGLTLTSGTSGPQATVSGTGSLTLVVTDSVGGTDTATIVVGATSATTAAPSAAGSTACPATLAVTPVAPAITAAFAPASVGVTVASTLTLTVTNANAFDLTQAGLTDTLPGGLAISTSPAPATTCTGAALSLTNTTDSLTLAGANIPAKGNCLITVTVTGATAGSYTDSLAAGALSTGPAGASTVAATATLTVTPPIAPTLVGAFAPAAVGENAVSTLTLTLGNTNAYPLTSAALTDTLPASLSIAASPAASTTCAGSLTATATSAKLTGGSIPAGGTCTVTLTVSSGTSGSYTDTLAAGALTTAQQAANGAAASATLTVNAPHGGGGMVTWLNVLGLVALTTALRRPSRLVGGRR